MADPTMTANAIIQENRRDMPAPPFIQTGPQRSVLVLTKRQPA
jgi:hypothetical protein